MYIYICTKVCMRARMRAWVYLCMYACMYGVCVHMYACMHVHLSAILGRATPEIVNPAV